MAAVGDDGPAAVLFFLLAQRYFVRGIVLSGSRAEPGHEAGLPNRSSPGPRAARRGGTGDVRPGSRRRDERRLLLRRRRAQPPPLGKPRMATPAGSRRRLFTSAVLRGSPARGSPPRPRRPRHAPAQPAAASGRGRDGGHSGQPLAGGVPRPAVDEAVGPEVGRRQPGLDPQDRQHPLRRHEHEAAHPARQPARCRTSSSAGTSGCATRPSRAPSTPLDEYTGQALRQRRHDSVGGGRGGVRGQAVRAALRVELREHQRRHVQQGPGAGERRRRSRPTSGRTTSSATSP